MKITALTENTSQREDILTEHGLSLCIETNKHKILFDMGQSDIFEKNARTLGIDLAEIDIAILSHGHYDHGGGLARFLEINAKAPVYVHRSAFGNHYSGTEKYIGLNPELKNSPRIIFTEDETLLPDGMKLLTCNGMSASHSLSNKHMNVMTDNGLTPDLFPHEQYLLIEENGKRTVVSGCSHKGILNITEWLSPDVIIGGFHFKNVPTEGDGKEKLRTAAKQLSEKNTVFYTCHCTGTEQYEIMKEVMGKKVHYVACGEEISF